MRSIVLAALLITFAVPQATAQPPGGGRGGQRPAMPPRAGGQAAEQPRGTSMIRGVVLAADTATPVRRAQVRAAAPGSRVSRVATTDAQGRFEFRELVAGRYTVTATKSGFITAQFGQRRPAEPGTPIELGDAQAADKVIIAMPRGSVIAGRITDEFGDPLPNASVTAFRYVFAAGGRRLTPSPARDTTDDLGQFRLFGLPPGEYVVSATYRTPGETTESTTEPSGYAPTYFPGTPNANEAQRVRVDVGQEQSSVVFAMVAARLVRVTGTVFNSHGQPVTNGNVMLGPSDGRLPGLVNAPGRLQRDGTFRITNVPPGRYRLQVRTNPAPVRAGARPADTMETGRLDVVVGNEDLSGVTIVTSPGARVTGEVILDTPQPPPFAPSQVQVNARLAEIAQGQLAGGASNARINADWTFEITGLFDRRLFRATAPQGWSLKQVLLNGQDITDTAVEFTPGQTVTGLQVVFTDKVQSLSGRVMDVRGEPVLDATVVVFPSDERLWIYQGRHVRAARPDQDGRYEMAGLPAYADYLIIAVQGLEDGQAADPEFLARVRDEATRFSLNEGETKAVDVRFGRSRP